MRPQLLQRESQQPVRRAAPSRRSSRPAQCGQPRLSTRSQRSSFQARPPSAWRVAFPVKAPPNLPARRRPLPPSLALARLPRVAPRSGPRSPPANPGKSWSPHRNSPPRTRRRILTETIDNAIRARIDLAICRIRVIHRVQIPPSGGQTEGQINHLKALKRTMDGRAGPEPLRAPTLPL